MTDEEKAKMQSDWKLVKEYICKRCSGQASYNPENPHQWGCAKCGFATFSVSVYFNDAFELVKTKLALIQDAYRRMATNRDEYYRSEQVKKVDKWLEEITQLHEVQAWI